MKRKIFSVMLSVLLLTATGCQSSASEQVVKAPIYRAEEVYKYTFDALGEDVMPIGGYYAPFGGYGLNGEYIESTITDEVYKGIADSGLNFIIASTIDYSRDHENAVLSYELAEKHNVMLFMRDSYLFCLKNGGDRDSSQHARNALFRRNRGKRGGKAVAGNLYARVLFLYDESKTSLPKDGKSLLCYGKNALDGYVVRIET